LVTDDEALTMAGKHHRLGSRMQARRGKLNSTTVGEEVRVGGTLEERRKGGRAARPLD